MTRSFEVDISGRAHSILTELIASSIDEVEL